MRVASRWCNRRYHLAGGRESAPAHEHLYDLGIMMVEEEALAGVESGDFLHVLVAE